MTDIANRMAPLNTHTYYEGGLLKVGQHIEVLDEHNKWLESFVIDENETQVSAFYKYPSFRLHFLTVICMKCVTLTIGKDSLQKLSCKI